MGEAAQLPGIVRCLLTDIGSRFSFGRRRWHMFEVGDTKFLDGTCSGGAFLFLDVEVMETVVAAAGGCAVVGITPLGLWEFQSGRRVDNSKC